MTYSRLKAGYEKNEVVLSGLVPFFSAAMARTCRTETVRFDPNYMPENRDIPRR
jgi:hypothetical protein